MWIEIIWSRSYYLPAKIQNFPHIPHNLSEKVRKINALPIYFMEILRNFELRSKILTIGNTQIYLVFR